MTPPVRIPIADPIKKAVRAAVALVRVNRYKTCKAETPNVCIPIKAAARKVKKRKHEITVGENNVMIWLNIGSIFSNGAEFLAFFSCKD